MRKLLTSIIGVWICAISVLTGTPTGDRLKPVFEYLARYWGAAEFSRNHKLFLGENPQVMFLTPQAMVELVSKLCRQSSVHCSPRPDHVMGKNLPDGRMAVVHRVLHPFYEALHVIHELEHQNDDPGKSAAQNELRARMREREFMRKILGDRWYLATVNLLQQHCKPVNTGELTYLLPTAQARDILRAQLEKTGISLPVNDQQQGTLWNSVLFLVNDYRVLMHPVFIGVFETGYGK